MRSKYYTSAASLAFSLLSWDARAQQSAPATSIAIAYITHAETVSGAVIIDADYVQMLNGAAAIAAARKRGEAEYELTRRGDTAWYVPNDYFVVNDNEKIRTIPLAANATIFLVKEGTSTPGRSSAAKLLHGQEGKLFRLHLAAGKVTKIEEIYTP